VGQVTYLANTIDSRYRTRKKFDTRTYNSAGVFDYYRNASRDLRLQYTLINTRDIYPSPVAIWVRKSPSHRYTIFHTPPLEHELDVDTLGHLLFLHTHLGQIYCGLSPGIYLIGLTNVCAYWLANLAYQQMRVRNKLPYLSLKVFKLRIDRSHF